MCPAGLRPRSSVKKKPTAARRSRTKNRKPKFLSLRRQISPENSHPSAKMLTTAANDHQLNLFPLHPEKLVDEKDTHDENVEYFFSAGDGGDTTLTGLLGVAASSSSSDENNALSPSSLTYGYPVHDGDEEGALVRTALKCKERDPSEEKWVCYSEVVEEVTSSAVDRRYKYQARRLSLKLDYEEIMNAWSDKGPLYIHVESPQIVPDLHDDFLSSHEYSNDTNGSGLWRVPEMKGCGGGNGGNAVAIKAEEEEVAEEYWKAIGHREASVLRYKEKRQNRLFSKKIRYEVRKLNAEKRPRIKGRFVKRD